MNENNQLAINNGFTGSISLPPTLESAYSLRDALKTLRRQKNYIFAAAAICLLVSLVYIALWPRLYEADAKIEILKQNAATDLGDPAQASASLAADALDFNLAAQTQVDVLQSRSLALRVIHELKLNESADYRVHANEKQPELDQDAAESAYAVKRFESRLKVGLISGTRLISVQFLDRDPARSAQVVNQLIADFIDHNFQTRFAASSQATSFLSTELEQMKQQVDASQANVVRLQQQSGIYGVDEANNATNARLEQLNAQVTAAQSTLALKKSVYSLAMTKNPEILAGMIGAQGTGANTANAPLQLLRQQQADAAAAYAELNAHYGSQYPKVIQAGEKLRAIQTSISSEVDRLTGQAAAEYKVAIDQEASASRALAAQKELAAKMNHDAILYTGAKHEADTSRDLYEQLLRRLKEAGVLAGIRSSNLKVLDAAVPPAKPAQPMVLLSLLIAAVMGLGLGGLLAFLVDAFDTRVRDPQKIEEASFAPVLGLLPPAHRALPKAAVLSLSRSAGSAWQYETTARAPRSALAEAFRALRTSILSIVTRRNWSVLAVTSTSEGEGKSFTTFNLASAIAQSGRTVVVVDGDMRKHTLTDSLGFGGHPGLDEAVFEPGWEDFVTAYVELPGLFVLPAGHQDHQPADLLGSRPMADLLQKLKERFDVVLIDTPSILAVTDTLSLSTAVDAVLVVAKCGRTHQHSLNRTLEVLRRGGAKVLGIVLNGIDFDSSDFYYYWGKQSSGYVANEAQILAPAPQVMPSHSVLRNSISVIALMLGLLLVPTMFGQTTLAKADDSSAVSLNRTSGSTGESVSRRIRLTTHHERITPIVISHTLAVNDGVVGYKVHPILLDRASEYMVPARPQKVVPFGQLRFDQPPPMKTFVPVRICFDCMFPAELFEPHSQLLPPDSVPYLVADLEFPEMAGQAQSQTGRVRLPMPGQIPDAPQGIVIGVGDVLNVTVYDAPELSQSVRVADTGNIHLTLLGDVKAEGLQPDQLGHEIEARYKAENLIRSPNVTIELKDFATQGITVEGEVTKPGIYPIYSARSLVDVLALAGGRNDSADSHVTIQRRQTHKLERVELQQNDSDQQAHSDVRVFPGDTVIVPRAGLAYVMGSVTRPGGYVMRDGGSMTVLQAISEAQGTTRLASRDKILLLRKSNDGTITIPIALKAMEQGKLPDQKLINGDVLFVPASGAKTFLSDTSAITASLSGAALYAISR